MQRWISEVEQKETTPVYGLAPPTYYVRFKNSLIVEVLYLASTARYSAGKEDESISLETVKATSYKVKNGLLKMAFSDEPISNKIFLTDAFLWVKMKNGSFLQFLRGIAGQRFSRNIFLNI